MGVRYSPTRQSVAADAGMSMAGCYQLNQSWVRAAGLLFALLLGRALPNLAQAPPSNVPTVIPPAPTAAALERYGQVPVSTYTGVPNISVPLYEIKVRDLTIPLSLSYHSAGFRVTEEASWVGLGWSLQAGGVLTHTTRNLDDLAYFIPQNGHAPYGMPDCTPKNGGENFSGYPYTGAMTIMAGVNLSGTDIRTYVQGVGLPYARDGVYENQQVDWEPDEYRFTMGNFSGAFAFDQQGMLHLLDQQPVRVSYAYAQTGKIFWTVQTPDGFRYEFAAAELTTTPGSSTTSAWYLTHITSPLGEEATLRYEQGPGIYNQPGYSQTEIKQQQYSAQPAAPTAAAYSAGSTVPQYLSRIEFKTGYVVFERDPQLRRDLRGGQRLRRVAVYSQDNQLLKAYDLQASYFETPAKFATGWLRPGVSSDFDTARAYEGRRLRLDAVVESGQQGLRKPPTRFTYNDTPLPAKSSYSVDYWGYFNGRANTSLIPTYAGPDLSGTYVTYQGADRTPAAGPMQAAILRTITHATGGRTTFTFEPHEYGNLTDESDQLIDGGVSLRLQVDNQDASATYATNTVIRVSAPTPLTLDYTLGVDSRGNVDDRKARTTIQLIDSTTNRPFTSGDPAQGSYVYAQWGFTSSTSTPSNPYNLPNWTQVTGHVVLLLPAGSYTLTGYTPTCGSATANCHALAAATGSYPIVQRVQNSTTKKLLAGGLRVKRIEEADGLDSTRTQVQHYTYGTSGVLLSRPVFSKVVKYFANNSESFRHILTSNSQTALSAGAKGSAVGYTQVSLLQGPGGKGGKITYSYYCRPDATVQYQDRQPSVPSRPDELNGSLLQQTTYRHDTTGFHRLSQTTNSYESVLDPQYHYDLPAVFKGEYFTTADFGENGQSKAQRLYFYSIPVNWVRLAATATQQYDGQDTTRALFTSTRYTYDTLRTGHMQVSQTRTRRSDGTTQLTLTTYPGDYTALTSGPLVSMRGSDTYQPTAVVETATLVYGATQTAADAKTVAGTYTSYTRPSSKSQFVPAVISHLELTHPQGGLRPAVPTLPPAGRYTNRQLLFYEAGTANLQQVRREYGLPTLYFWGYGGTLPVAQVQGATLAQVQAALGVDPATLTTDQQLRDAFQRVRRQLPRAQVTSFTQQPLVGVTSRTEPDGRTFTYEYDGLQRLVRTRDEQGRILSQQAYHYAGQ